MERKKPKPRRRPTDELIAKALALQERGALAEAEQRYRELLRHEPDHHAAMNLLAMILLERNDPAAATPLITRAIIGRLRSAIASTSLEQRRSAVVALVVPDSVVIHRGDVECLLEIPTVPGTSVTGPADSAGRTTGPTGAGPDGSARFRPRPVSDR